MADFFIYTDRLLQEADSHQAACWAIESWTRTGGDAWKYSQGPDQTGDYKNILTFTDNHYISF